MRLLGAPVSGHSLFLSKPPPLKFHHGLLLVSFRIFILMTDSFILPYHHMPTVHYSHWGSVFIISTSGWIRIFSSHTWKKNCPKIIQLKRKKGNHIKSKSKNFARIKLLGFFFYLNRAANHITAILSRLIDTFSQWFTRIRLIEWLRTGNPVNCLFSAQHKHSLCFLIHLWKRRLIIIADSSLESRSRAPFAPGPISPLWHLLQLA